MLFSYDDNKVIELDTGGGELDCMDCDSTNTEVISAKTVFGGNLSVDVRCKDCNGQFTYLPSNLDWRFKSVK